MSTSDHDLALSVVVLAYNEVDNLSRAISELLHELSQRPDDWELIVVDDGSTDGSGALAERLAQGHARVRVVRHTSNLGLGGGYRTGFREARGAWLTFFPADGQFPAEIISAFYKHTPNVDMILGFLPNRDTDALGKALSLIERVLYRLLFRSFPRFQGIMMFKRSLLTQIPLISEGRGWAVVMELVLRVSRGPYRLLSVPTEVRPRLSGSSKVNNVKTIVANLRQLYTLSRRL